MKPHERLQQARRQAGYATATSAAEAYGWPPSTYLGHENGSRGINQDAAQRYARAFGVSWSWILGGDDVEFDELLQNLGSIPVSGVIDPDAFRPYDFSLDGAPDRIAIQLFGYESRGLKAFVLYYGWPHVQHFLITADVGAASIRDGDEIVVRRLEGGRYELAAWRLTQQGRDHVLSPAYAPHIQMAAHPVDILDEPGTELLGIVVAELKIKSRRETPWDAPIEF